MTETPTKRMIPALPATIEGVRGTWRRWTLAPLLSHVDPRCPTCAYDGGSVLAFGLAGEPPVIRFSAHRCPACDEMTIYERVPQQSPPPFVRSREVAYSPPRTEEPNMSDVEPRPEVVDELVGLAVRANANRSHADLCGCATWPERCASGYIPSAWEHGDEAHTIAAVLPAHERLVRKRVADETRRLARRWAVNAQATPAGAERERRFAVANVLTEHADSIERGEGR